MIFSSPIPITDALRHQTLKKVLALSPEIGTEEIQKYIAPGIREKAFFSARTPYADYLQEASSLIQRLIQPDVRRTSDGTMQPTAAGESVSFAQARALLKRKLEQLGYEPDPEKRGSLQDLSSDPRINLILNTQLAQSRGYGSWRQGQSSATLFVYPAQELYRAINSKVRRSWSSTWNNARGDLGNTTTATEAYNDSGPFIATKTDQIWKEISRFHEPYPPFDFNSGMRIKNVTRRKAVEAGVLDRDERVQPAVDPMLSVATVHVDRSTPSLIDAILKVFAPNSTSKRSANEIRVIPQPEHAVDELLFRHKLNQKSSAPISFFSDNAIAKISELVGKSIDQNTTFDLSTDGISHAIKRHGPASNDKKKITLEQISAIRLQLSGVLPRRPTLQELKDQKDQNICFDIGDAVVGCFYGGNAKRLLFKTMYRK